MKTGFGFLPAPISPGSRLCLVFIGVALMAQFCSAAVTDSVPQPLFNGQNLDGWETWLGAPTEGQPALGWNQDPKQVFTVVTVDGAQAIRCSGEVCGSLVTKAAFESYRLRVEFKWGDRRWPPRERDQRDSGIFYHTTGTSPPPGSSWLAGSQCSLAEVDSGDFWPIHVTAEARSRRANQTAAEAAELTAWYRRNGVSNMPWRWDPKGELRPFAGGLMSGGGADKPLGEWNVAEVICAGDTATHVINGRTNLVLLNLRRELDGKSLRLTHGRIQLQSEQAEIFFRRVELWPLPSP